MVLGDSGFSDDEAMTWLLNTDESLGTTPIDALRARRAVACAIAQAIEERSGHGLVSISVRRVFSARNA